MYQCGKANKKPSQSHHHFAFSLAHPHGSCLWQPKPANNKHSAVWPRSPTAPGWSDLQLPAGCLWKGTTMAGGDPTDDARLGRAGPFAKAGNRFKSCGERKLVDVVSNAEPHCFNRVFFDFCPRFSTILWEIVCSIVLGLANGGALVQVSTTCHNEPHVRWYRYNIMYIYTHMHTCYLVSVPTKPNYPGWWTQLADPSQTKDEPFDSFYPVGLTTAETLHGYFILIFQLKEVCLKIEKNTTYHLSLHFL